jgi:hypothetical protein
MLSGGLVSFFEEWCFSIICTRLRMDLRRSLCASKRVTDIASALADGSEHSLFGQTRIFGTLTQSTGRNRRGKHDFIGGRPPRPWTERISSSQSAYARGITQSRDLKSSLCGQKVVFDTIYMVCMVTTVDLECQLSLLDLGLTKAHRSCVDGDGAASVWTVPELKSELSQNLLEDLTVSADFAPTVDLSTRLHESVRAMLICGAPTSRQLALVSYGLTFEQQQLQQSRQRWKEGRC